MARRSTRRSGDWVDYFMGSATARRRKPAPRRSGDDQMDPALAGFVVAAALALYLPLSGPLLLSGWLVDLGLWCVTFTLALFKTRRRWLALYRWRRQRVTVAAPVMAGRAPMPAGLRFAVLRRDGFRCQYCGRGEPEGARLHVDHLVPVARGGRNEIDNLVTACQDCNLGKSASDLVGG